MPELKVVTKQEVIKCEVSEFRKDEEQKITDIRWNGEEHKRRIWIVKKTQEHTE